MKTVLIYLIIFVSMFSQTREDIFYEDKSDSNKRVISVFPDLMLETGIGYIIHENNRFTGTTYTDNYSFDLNVKKYFFKGSYLFFNITTSNTDFGRYKGISQNLSEIDTVTFIEKNYTYFSYYLGIDYFFNSKDFNSPWFFGFGLGSNSFIASGGSESRFSMQIHFGKITSYEILGGNLAFDVSALLFEDRGIQFREDPFFQNTYYTYSDWVLFTSLKFSLTLNYDISKLINN